MQAILELTNHADFSETYVSSQQSQLEWDAGCEWINDPMADAEKQLYKRLPVEPVEIAYDMRFTRDKDLISQYKLLRKELYGIDPRFVGFRIFNEIGAENYEDPDDQMLILHNGNRCFGGACLRVSSPKQQVMLDLENDILPDSGKYYFSLRERFPEMELDKYAYAEFNRIVLHPSLRKGDATRRIFQAVLERCVDYRVRYMFGIGDRVRTRLYRQVYHSMGLESHIRDDVDIPLRDEYEGVKMYLLAGDMKNFHAVPNDPDANFLLKPLDNFEFF